MSAPATHLRRDLGLLSATSVVVGSMIGVGIFLGPQRIAGLVETPFLVLAVWLVGGLFIFFGALTYGELGAALPQSGGHYVFMREAYGPGLAFATGWTAFTVGKSASVAALAVGFAEYLGALRGAEFGAWESRIIALALILLLTVVNVLGVRHAGRVQVVSTFLKVGALGVLVVGGLALLATNFGALTATPALSPTQYQSTGAGGVLALFGLALVPAFFAYDGWVNSTQVAEEVKDPAKNVPRSLILGVLAVAVVYALTNLVYLLALGADGVATSRFAAADAAEAMAGPAGRVLIVLAILVSITGTVNAVILSGPRITFAMSRDGLFFRKFSQIHPRYGTPAWSIAAQSVWSGALVLIPTVGALPLFETLLTYVVFDSFIFYLLGAVAVFILRKKRPDLPRPYKAWGYPVVPALFIALTGAFLVNALINSPQESLMGLALIAAGIPFYLHFRSRERDRARSLAPGIPLSERVARNVTYTMREPSTDQPETFIR